MGIENRNICFFLFNPLIKSEGFLETNIQVSKMFFFSSNIVKKIYKNVEKNVLL